MLFDYRLPDGFFRISGQAELNWLDSVRLDVYCVENWSCACDVILGLAAGLMKDPVGDYKTGEPWYC